MEEAEPINPEDFGEGFNGDDVIAALQPELPAAATRRTQTSGSFLTYIESTYSSTKPFYFKFQQQSTWTDQRGISIRR